MFKKLCAERGSRDIQAILAGIDNDSYFATDKMSKMGTLKDFLLKAADKNYAEALTKIDLEKQQGLSTQLDEDGDVDLEAPSFLLQKAAKDYQSLIDNHRIEDEDVFNKLLDCLKLLKQNKLFQGYQEKLYIVQKDKLKNALYDSYTDFAEYLASKYAYPKGQLTLEKIKPLLQNYYAIGNEKAVQVYEIAKKYLDKLFILKDEEKALQLYDFMIVVNPKDLSIISRRAEYYYSQKNYDRAELLYKEIKELAIKQKNDDLICEAKGKLWRIYRKTERYEECINEFNEAVKNNHLKFLFRHLQAGFDYPESNNDQYLRDVRENLDYLKDIFSHKILEGNQLIPAYHFELLELINNIDDISQDDPSTLGMIHFDPENSLKLKIIEIYERGLSLDEKIQVKCHEISHNVAMNIISHPEEVYRYAYKRWILLAEQFDLSKQYEGQADPVQEAFADYYASWLMFGFFWQKYSMYSEKNRLINNYFKWLFFIDSYEDVHNAVRQENNQALVTSVEETNQSIEDVMLLLEIERKDNKKHKSPV